MIQKPSFPLTSILGVFDDSVAVSQYSIGHRRPSLLIIHFCILAVKKAKEGGNMLKHASCKRSAESLHI